MNRALSLYSPFPLRSWFLLLVLLVVTQTFPNLFAEARSRTPLHRHVGGQFGVVKEVEGLAFSFMEIVES